MCGVWVFLQGLSTNAMRFDDVCVDKNVPTDMKFIDIVSYKNTRVRENTPTKKHQQQQHH